MHIVIVGVGKIGSIICKELADEHDVVVIEQNADKLESFINTTDVTGIAASGVDVDALQSADTTHADVFIAVTAQDEINIISCIFAKQMGAKYTIARIREHEYTAHQSFIKESIGIDAIINPERESARQITSLLRFPATTRVESFVRGRINIVEYPLPQDHPFVGQTLAEFQNQFKEHVLVVIVERNGQAIIPKGNFRLQAGDIIHVSGSSAEILNFFLRDGKGKHNRRVKSLMIIGAGRLTHYLLREIEQGSTKYHIKVLENNRKTAELLAQLHPNVEVVFADGSNYRSLEEEGISGYDCLIALTGIDEENILICMYAENHGMPATIAKVNRTQMLEILGEDRPGAVITPGNIIAIRPLREGVISDYDMTERMLKEFIHKVAGVSFFKPRVIICVPSGITEVEERAVIDAVGIVHLKTSEQQKEQRHTDEHRPVATQKILGFIFQLNARQHIRRVEI